MFIRALLVLFIWIGVAHWIGDAGMYTSPINILVFLGAVSVFLGPLATEGGFWARFHYVNVGTPGCVWYALGIICWGIAVALILSARQTT
jgi:hypothetical protein